MMHLTPTRPPRHLDDDWLYADPMAMGTDGCDDVQRECCEPALPTGRRRRLRPWHLLGAGTAGALLGLVLTSALNPPQSLEVARAGTSAPCPEPGDMTAEFRTTPGFGG